MQIIVQKIMLDTIDCSAGLNSHLFETDPNKNGTADMVSNQSGLATLISFNTR
jgi:hypothetical protein